MKEYSDYDIQKPLPPVSVDEFTRCMALVVDFTCDYYCNVGKHPVTACEWITVSKNNISAVKPGDI